MDKKLFIFLGSDLKICECYFSFYFLVNRLEKVIHSFEPLIQIFI